MTIEVRPEHFGTTISRLRLVASRDEQVWPKWPWAGDHAVLTGEWAGIEMATGRAVHIAALWEDRRDGIVALGATCRYMD